MISLGGCGAAAAKTVGRKRVCHAHCREIEGVTSALSRLPCQRLAFWIRHRVCPDMHAHVY